jgi:hypothetical protein
MTVLIITKIFSFQIGYRLPVSVLVAVIRLTTSREAISKKYTIQWAEIVPYDSKFGANQDWTFRASGKMAIRLLTSADCCGMPEEITSTLSLGTRVAIIDLRVFVPEVISVLSTFSKPDFKDQMSKIPFFDRLIGQESPARTLAFEKTAQISVILANALDKSEIDYVQRLSSGGKAQMIREICSLKPIQTLYGTQLEAFAWALSSSVHCTQGPPGTGKVIMSVMFIGNCNNFQKYLFDSFKIELHWRLPSAYIGHYSTMG